MFISFHKLKKKSKLNIQSFSKQRFMALFFVLVFIASIAMPSVVYASEAKPKTVTPKSLNSEKQESQDPIGSLGKTSSDAKADATIIDPSKVGVNYSASNATEQNPIERTQDRTEFTETFDIGNNKTKYRQHLDRVSYQKDGKWQKIDNSLIEDTNAADSKNIFGKSISLVKGKVQKLNTYKLKANDWQARFAPSGDKVGMVRIESGGKKIALKPQNTIKNVNPEILTDNGIQYVIYRDLWPNTDVEYHIKGGALKEDIVIKNKQAKTNYAFKVEGAKLTKNKDGGFDIEGATDQALAPLSVSLNTQGVVSEQIANQNYSNGIISINIDANWLNNVADVDFPVIVDPTWTRTGAIGLSYTAYKSDGYVCSSSVCYMNAGTLSNNGWKHWRSVFRVNFDVLQGKQLLDADLYLTKMNRADKWLGTGEGLWYEVRHASCFGFNCIDYNGGYASAWFGQDAWMDVTGLMQARINAGDWGAWFIINGEERPYTTYKGFNADNMFMDFVYNSAPPMTTPASPSKDQVVVTDQPQLIVNPVNDPNGDRVQYYFRISDKPDGESGNVINSGLTDSNQWTVPEGRLQDGVTYYWRAYTHDACGSYANGTCDLWGSPNWVQSFKYDARLGQDTTASFDDGGPVDVNLATGNVTTSASTHSMNALGGNMGLNFEYNSPMRTRPGLTAEYYNNNSHTGTPAVRRVDANIDFNWSTGSPAPGIVPVENFSVKWTGYFVAPKTGNYYFGGNNDDGMSTWVTHRGVSKNPYVWQGCFSGVCMGSEAIQLNEGEVMPISIYHSEYTSVAYAKAYVKIDAQAPQIIPTDWLRTNPMPTNNNNGLMGKYYYSDPSNRIFPSDEFSSFVQRRETNMYFNWGSGSPVAGGPVDNFMVRYSGYFTAPVNGTYYFGAASDDGSRIFINGNTNAYMNAWRDQGWTLTYGGAVSLNAGQTIPITAEFYENGGAAGFGLYVRGSVPEQIIPSTWLSTKINPLPNGWNMSADADGNLTYDYAVVNAQDIVLYDSSGDSHTYKLSGQTYTPPVNEYGYLTKNANGSFTLLDSDGTTYNFDSAGRITSTSTPSDDRKPASLKYEYGGVPVRLQKIVDGLDNSRSGTLYYSGDYECGAVPNGFDASAPANMLCAYKTSDNQATYLYYQQGQLARISVVGDTSKDTGVKDSNRINTDIGYDTLGRMTSQRSSTAYDVVANGIRQDNTSVTSQVEYDAIGRASAITLPSANENGFRPKHTYNYLTSATQTNEIGETEPKGYSQRTEYDGLYRTTKAYGKDGNATQQQWHSVKDLLLSSTDATGLKSTTIYDTNDLPTESYGPAPKEWYGADDKPTASYINQVPKTETKYDEGLVGPAVSWFDYSSANGGMFIGAPKYHSTSFDPAVPDRFWQDTGVRPAPITKSANATGYGFTATANLTVPTTGNYTFSVYNDDAMRLYVNDTLVIDRWANRNTSVTQGTGTIYLEANKTYRFKFDYANVDNGYMAFSLNVNGPGLVTTSDKWGNALKPSYNLATSSKVLDSQAGNVTTKTDYGTQPELGQAKNVTEDLGGLNLTTSFGYEPYQAGSLMRQTSKTMPGGNTYQYLHYGATEARANPCVTGSPSVSQAGFAKGKIEPEPDNNPATNDKPGINAPRISESVYDASGRVVATKFNNDAWTCTEYDARGRITKTVIPEINGRAGRVIVNNYLVNNNPLITSTSDSNSVITVETDLLGRVVKYTDAKNDATTSQYDNTGRLTSRAGPLGNEQFSYDDYDRLITQKLDDTIYATVSYDSFSRISSVTYPNNISLTNISRDQLGRMNKLSYNANGQTLQDEVTRYASGDIKSGIENGITKNYSYDGASRLTSASIGTNNYTYSFGSQDTSCNGLVGFNPNAGKNGNRVSQTINGKSTNYCYNYADQLISSSDSLIGTPVYDDHGNTVSFGNDTQIKTTLNYDASDRNIAISEQNNTIESTTQTTQVQTGTDEQGNPIYTNQTQTTNTSVVTNKQVTYKRDLQNRILERTNKTTKTINSTTTDTVPETKVSYGYTGSGDTPDYIKDNTGNITEKYLTLPGNVLITIRPNEQELAKQKTYSIPNIHGDIFATINNSGNVIATHLTGPFGENIANQTNPTNTVAGTTYNYVGQYQKLTENEFTLPLTQMGARVYLTSLGRFTQVDPVEGGTDNAYAYANDPVNDFDLDGTFIPFVVGALYVGGVAWSAYEAKKNPNPTNMGFLALAVVPGGGGFKVGGKLGQFGVRNLSEKLAIKSVKANPKMGERTMIGKINDPRYKERDGWAKMRYVHRPLTEKGKKIVIHYFYNEKKRITRQVKVKRY